MALPERPRLRAARLWADPCCDRTIDVMDVQATRKDRRAATRVRRHPVAAPAPPIA